MSILELPSEAIIPPRRAEMPVGLSVSNHSAECFACKNDDGLKVKVLLGADLQATGTFYAAKKFQGGPGVLHGGILALAFDEVLGATTRLVTEYAVTGSLEIVYHQPLLVQREVTIIGKVLGRLRRKIYIEGQAFISDNCAPVAIAKAVFISIDPCKHFAQAVEALDS